MALLKWFKNEPVDESFLSDAPFRISESFDVAKPAADAWAELTSDNPLSWCRIIQDISWTSPRPLGLGSTRTVKALGGLNRFREHFFIWEEGRRHAFYVVEATSPLFKRFAEDYVVEPTGDDSCRFTWTIAGDPRPPAALANPGNKLVMGTLFRDTRKHYGAG